MPVRFEDLEPLYEGMEMAVSLIEELNERTKVIEKKLERIKLINMEEK